MWSVIGVVLLVDRQHALDYFPYMWFANDVAIAAALVGVLMHFLAGPPSPGLKIDEWTGWDPTDEHDLPLEALVGQLAARAQAQPGGLTSASHR